jgi:hypothetical protein
LSAPRITKIFAGLPIAKSFHLEEFYAANNLFMRLDEIVSLEIVSVLWAKLA